MSTERFVTRSGKVLTGVDLERLADEAERGYDVDPADIHLIPPQGDCSIHGCVGSASGYLPFLTPDGGLVAIQVCSRHTQLRSIELLSQSHGRPT